MSSSTDNYDDLNELIDEEDIIDGGNEAEMFNLATTYVQSAAGTLDNAVLLQLYSYYKQTTEGPCKSENRPSWYDFRAKSKYEAWHALGAMPKAEARLKYIEIVEGLGQDLSIKAKHKNETAAKLNASEREQDNNLSERNANVGWVTHSTLQQYGLNEEAENEVCEPNMRTLLDLISSNDLSSVKRHLLNHPELISRTSGCVQLAPVHYAADRGSACVLEYLLSFNKKQGTEKSDDDTFVDIINIKDADGQTPLHYASACGHADCCKILLKYGANIELKDNDEQSCLDVAADAEIKQLLLSSGK